MIAKPQQAHDNSLGHIDKDDSFILKNKDASTLSSMIDSSLKKFHKTQDFYTYHHNYFHITTLSINYGELTIKGNINMTIPLWDVLGASYKEERKIKPKIHGKSYHGGQDCSLHRFNVYLLRKHCKGEDKSQFIRKYEVFFSIALKVRILYRKSSSISGRELSQRNGRISWFKQLITQTFQVDLFYELIMTNYRFMERIC